MLEETNWQACGWCLPVLDLYLCLADFAACQEPFELGQWAGMNST